ncbi:MAG: FAD-dependent pyridine nucleotide-disulfide oxidoreductase [Gemmatimonadetes bacterium]|nr:FAD-dependent pyridine nucleotide-disulfide oxidoreductase [Gemmatimonadota bacterium]
MTDASGMRETERIETVVIGGGQAGLSTGYHLAQLGRSFLILEGNARIGDTWRKRWDSLRLFSPARFDGLAGLPFPAPRHSNPTKDEMGDYLEGYATHFELPVRTGTRVERVWREGSSYRISAGDVQLAAQNVVVAMAGFQVPRVPALSSSLDAGIVQLHSTEYRNTGQLREGAVLIVGAGNSGAEIGRETVRAGFPTFVSGRATGQVPFDIQSVIGRNILLPLMFRIIFHRVLTLDTPVGRRARPKMLAEATPLIRTKERDLAALGVTRVPRVVDTRDGKPLLDDGRTLDVQNVIWCTGFHPGLEWLDLPILGAAGEPQQERGMVSTYPGLFFVGQHFQYSMSSAMIHGVGRDAQRAATAIAQRASGESTRAPLPVA